MNPGDVILIDLPQADGRQKVRPALVLAMVPPFGDSLVCGVSTQLRHAVPDFDEVVKPGDPDFSSSGLIAPSLIRLGFLNSIPARRLAGVLGAVSSSRLLRLRKRLAQFFTDVPG